MPVSSTAVQCARRPPRNSFRLPNTLYVITVVITSEVTVVELKIRKFGNSLGVVLPKEVINRLHARAARLFS